MTDTTITYNCSVCREPAQAAMTAECNWCNARYHLNQRNDVEGKDCGQVWVDEQYLALQFACNTCLTGTERDPNPSEPVSGSPAAARQQRSANRAVEPRTRRYKRRA